MTDRELFTEKLKIRCEKIGWTCKEDDGIRFDISISNGKDRWKIWFVNEPMEVGNPNVIGSVIELYHYNHSIKQNSNKTASKSGNEYHMQFKSYYATVEYLLSYLIRHAEHGITVKRQMKFYI